MKYFIVVGGSKGIGREFIKKLLQNKKNIVLLISRNCIDNISENLFHYKTDLLNIGEVKETLNSILQLNYKIDSIVFFQKYRPFDKMNYNLQEDFIINVEATKIIIEAISVRLAKKGLKSIVVIGSIASKFVATEQPVDYHISKSALVGLVNYYAVSLGKLGIRINMVSPGSVIKDENKKFYKNNKNLKNLYNSLSPLNSIVRAIDVVNLVKYLLSKKSKFITGQNILIDGGVSLQWQEVIGRKFFDTKNIKITQ